MSKSIYTDLDLNMGMTHTGDIKSLNDEDCLRQSLKNILSLNKFDIPFNTRFAVDLKKWLFELPNKITENEMKKRIISAIELDPRFEDPSIGVSLNEDESVYTFKITVFVVMLNKTITEDIDVKRVR